MSNRKIRAAKLQEEERQEARGQRDALKIRSGPEPERFGTTFARDPLRPANATHRAAILHAGQRAIGNKAIQRLVNRMLQPQAESPAPGVYRTVAKVQREEEEEKEESPGKTVFEPIDNQSYRIRAKTLSEAAAAMDAHDPEEWGKCKWDPQLETDFDTSTGAITKATVTVVIAITMPKWKGAKKLSEAAKAEWDRFYQALLDHENGHVDLVHEHLADLGESLIGKTTEEANAACAEAMTDLQTDSDEYDVDTDHGRNEGTIIDTSIE